VSADVLAADDVLAAGMVGAAASLLTRRPWRRRRCLDMIPPWGSIVGYLPLCICHDKPKLKS